MSKHEGSRCCRGAGRRRRSASRACALCPLALLGMMALPMDPALAFAPGNGPHPRERRRCCPHRGCSAGIVGPASSPAKGTAGFGAAKFFDSTALYEGPRGMSAGSMPRRRPNGEVGGVFAAPTSPTRLGVASAPAAAAGGSGGKDAGGKTRADRRSKAGRGGTAAPPRAGSGNAERRRQRQRQLSRRRRPPPSDTNMEQGAWYQRGEMLDHEILTLEQDLEMGRRIQRATQLREALGCLADDRRNEIAIRAEGRRGGEGDADYCRLGMGGFYDADDVDGNDDGDGDGSQWTLGGDDADALLSDGGLFALGLGAGLTGPATDGNGNGYYATNGDDDDVDAGELISESSGYSILSPGEAAVARRAEAMHSFVMVDEGSRFASDPIERDLRTLSDDDVSEILEVPGGRDGLRRILRDGAEARQTLMRCNVRLVVSVAKRWMRNSAASLPASDPAARSPYRLNSGGWDRPSLDDVVQEGVVGLSRAVDKYDPDRGLRFSTYSTHWITNYVRLAFQSAKTGCLKVPYQLHEIKNRYKRLLREHYDEGTPVPPTETLAETLGVSASRLETALRVTESLLSLDQPISTSSYRRGGSAGVLGPADTEILISDTLQCREPKPEDHVELSFLRQCLENAMAAELSPHERDVLRLRLGLDDGQSRTVREVVEVCGGAIRAADVRSAERRAFRKLSSPNALHAYHLRDYLHMAGLDYDCNVPARRRR